MRILLINQAYAPDAAATAQHAEDLARHLVGRGHGVAVVASRSIYGRAGAELPRYEVRDGVEVHRVGLSLFGKRGVFLRLIDFGLFYMAAAWRACRVDRPDVVVTLTTPPFIATVGGLLKRLRGTRHIYWAMDLYPDVLVAAGVCRERAWLTRALERLNRRCLRRADRVVVLGRCMRDRVLGKGVPAGRVATIGVWPAHEPVPEIETPSSYREEWGLGGKFVVQYSGNFGLAHDAQTFFDAILRLRDEPEVVFLFAGGGKRVASLEAWVREHGLTNVMIRPYQPRERLGELLALASVHLISQSETFRGVVVPSKLFGVMAAGQASLFVGPESAEVARVLSENGAGLRFTVGDSAGLARAITRLRDEPEVLRRMRGAALSAATQEHARRGRFEAWEKLLVETCAGQA